MPTVSEPEVKEAKPQLVKPQTEEASHEPELFAAEIEMEKKSSSILPLLLVLGLLVVVGGTIFYLIKGAREVLERPAATAAINNILKSQGAASIRFIAGGLISSNVNEKAMDPHYKLLAKAGVVNTKPKSWNSQYVYLTPAGEKYLAGINNVQKDTNPDKTVTYLVPLATRQLVSIDKITMIRPHLARVDYTWKWDPNRLGKEFDASGDLVKSFNTWDRGTLIKSYGVDFFGAAPTKVSVLLMEAKDGVWTPYVE